MCSKYACQAAAHLLVIARRSKAQSEERKPKAAPTYCYKIHYIHGQRDVDPGQLTAKKRQNAIDDADYEDAYLVHGDFGEDADDNGYKDTRWVLPRHCTSRIYFPLFSPSPPLVAPRLAPRPSSVFGLSVPLRLSSRCHRAPRSR